MTHKENPKPGKNEKYDFSTYQGNFSSCQINNLKNLPTDRIIVILQRIKKQLKNGMKLDGDDDTSIGSKNTTCTWGLCNENKEVWRDAKDHVFPYDFLNEGRLTPLDQPPGACPMQDMSKHKEGDGCFFSCRFFQGKPPSREQYLRWIDEKISQLKKEGK